MTIYLNNKAKAVEYKLARPKTTTRELEKKFNDLKSETVSFVNDKTDEVLKEIQRKVNEEMNKFSQIQGIVLQPMPFEKTPTQKIKRFLYYA